MNLNMALELMLMIKLKTKLRINILKTFLKTCWSLFPGGRASWKNLRNASLGERQKLPDDVRLISEDTEVLKPTRTLK